MTELESLEVFVPGRLCILGEHTDWIAQYRGANPSIPKGYTLVCATNEGLHARVHEYAAGKVKFSSTSYDHSTHTLEEELNADAFKEKAKLGGFLSYAYGTMSVLLEHPSLQNKEDLGGLWIDNYHTSLPMKKGLSSSAAVCVLIVKAFARRYNLQLDTAE
eukprot:gene39517-48113_t